MYSTHIRTAVAALGLVSIGLLGTACGDDEADAQITPAPASTAAPTTTAAPAPATTEHAGHTDAPSTTEPTTTQAPADDADAPAVIEVHAADYGFGGIPDTVAAGTAFQFVNDSTAEVHEMVAVRLPDTETRSVAEIVQAQDFGALFASGDPALVIVAAPNGGDPFVPVGDGTLTEPGRYAVVCFIPTGADPQAYLEAAASSDGPPQVEGGAPHLMNGMYDEVVVSA